MATMDIQRPPPPPPTYLLGLTPEELLTIEAALLVITKEQCADAGVDYSLTQRLYDLVANV